MRVLILGGSGMLGHKLWQVLSPQMDTYITFRRDFAADSDYGIFDAARSKCAASVGDINNFAEIIEALKPDVVVNCIGVVKQSEAAKDPLISIAVNSLFPHQVAQICDRTNSRLIHISTDCVFSGRSGNYTEEDVSDAEDLYGRSKYLGEISGDHRMTIRTSLIGRELKGSNGLIEWFLGNEGKTVPGYAKAFFSGLTTNAIASLLAQIIQDHPELNGVWHIASDPISKHDLLASVKDVFALDIEITPDDSVVVNRTLNADKFRKATGIVAPSWRTMIEEMHQDTTDYVKLRRAYAE
jgi:dTDP-4-dehydrorhamnose reductase